MTLAALEFVFGAWLLQQQPVLPSIFICLQTAWAYILVLGAPSLAVFIYFNCSQHPIDLKNFCILLVAGLLGFAWAANVAVVRLSDALPKDWQQKKYHCDWCSGQSAKNYRAQ